MSDKTLINMKTSITKALCSLELPLKEKHARSTILATFQFQGACEFWAVVFRQPLMENRISAWKFCHLLHKVLREGHPLCCQQSMQNRQYLHEFGTLWGHLADGYGICILHYSKLLKRKIEFHDKYPLILGTFQMDDEEMEKLGGEDMNNVFQLCIEIFDYLDEIIVLQTTIFHSVRTLQMSSITATGQCLMAPLVPCIQDSKSLYDCAVNTMFRLHNNLPHDLLRDLRQRFDRNLILLRNIFLQAAESKYFELLIDIPQLPDRAPNFTLLCDHE